MYLSQELNSKAEGKFNRLKAQAKTKIAALNKELERLREGQGEPQLNLSAQVSRLLLFLSRGTMACVGLRYIHCILHTVCTYILPKC